MSDTTARKVPSWFMIVSVIFLIWNLLGVIAYLHQVTMDPEALAAMPEAQRQILENTPDWATAAFAVATNCGALGCLLLLLKRNLAGLFLQISLAGVLVQMYHAFFVADAFEVLGPGGVVMPLIVTVIAIFLVVLAAKARVNHWTT